MDGRPYGAKKANENNDLRLIQRYWVKEVRPGDVIRGDASGLVVVPQEHLPAVLAMTQTVADQEDGWRQAIAGGASLAAAAGLDDLIAQLARERASGLTA